jgi:Zeta toxin
METQKRLVIMLGGKGGIGKTLIMRAAYYHLIQNKVKVAAYDTDSENPEFYYHYQNSPNPVSKIDFSKFKGGVELIDKIAADKPNVILMDSAAASSNVMKKRFEELDILGIAKEWGYEVTMLAVIDSGHSSVESFKSMMEYCQKRANYLVVLNGHFMDEGFEQWLNSETRKELHDYNFMEIGFPDLDSSIIKILDGNDKNSRLSFIGYEEHFKDQIGKKLAIRSFLNRSLLQFAEAAEYIGIPKTVSETGTEKAIDKKAGAGK